MTQYSFFHVDAFADRPLAGNPAAVILLDDWLDQNLMQAIAAELMLSDTAFAVPAEDENADYQLRWFTPTTEVELCGHATLASAHVLIDGERIRFATRSGPLTVVRADGLLELDVPANPVERATIEGLLPALGLSKAEVFLGRSGSHILVVAANEEIVRGLRPDLAALAHIEGVISVTARGEDHAITSRVFAPAFGINEDPVTGSAHAALVPFWAERLGRSEFTALQASARSGVLRCRVDGDRVILGGRCATVIEGTIQL